MPLTTSLYLEALRGIAALLVFALHITFQGFTGGFLWRLGIFGEDAVMAFFVLSGFVISFSAKNKNFSFSDYMIARTARLWSVAIPAIILTLALNWIVTSFFDPTIMANERPDFSAFSVITSALFINQIWHLNETPGVNFPFWSLSYEFFYYVLFAFLYYFRGQARVVFAVLTVAVAGPKIMLFMPVWMMGVAAYYLCQRPLARSTGWLLLAGSFVAFAIYYCLNIKSYLHSVIPAGQILDNGAWDNDVLVSRYLFGLIVFANIVGFGVVGNVFTTQLTRAAGVIKFIARYSFSLYLYHFALLMFFRSLSTFLAAGQNIDPVGTWWEILLMYTGTLGGTYLLGRVTEPRNKDVGRAIKRVLSRFSPQPSHSAPVERSSRTEV